MLQLEEHWFEALPFGLHVAVILDKFLNLSDIILISKIIQLDQIISQNSLL